MADDDVLKTAVRLGASVDALAALAAHLRLATEQLPADPVVRNLLAIIAAELVGDGAPDAAAAAPPTIGLARTFLRQAHPTLHLVGIDIFEPALDLARANVEGAGLADRTELRLQDAAPAPVRLYAGLRR